MFKENDDITKPTAPGLADICLQ